MTHVGRRTLTNEELCNLIPGDIVHWTDPDGGSCSRNYTIDCIDVREDMVTIEDEDGDVLECPPEELSHGCHGDGCNSRGYDEWELGPDHGFWCCDCLEKYFPLKSVPQEWIIDRD